ncbi:hypothetical protein [Micromonospora sp. NPDC049679]|uniref:hypothetical protein n=1 Tax=Micromonospora sp. NPDC049679 TaxID=3155920 RepID=UPI0033D23622
MGADRHESPVPAPAGSVFLQHYDRLVRIAYLVAPATRRRQSQLVRAHRLVQRSLPWRSRVVRTYPQLVARVLRRAARPRRLALPALVTWAWHTPVNGSREHRAVVSALAAAPAPVRAAYVLLMVERLPAREAVVLLHEAGWAEGVAHVAAASGLRQRLGDELGISVDRQRELLAGAPADPTVVRLRAPDPETLRVLRVARLGAVSLAMLVVAALVTTSLVGAAPQGATVPATVGMWAAPETAPLTVRRVAAQAWAGASELSLASWPARGTRTGDDQLVRAAVTAWQRLHGTTDDAGAGSGGGAHAESTPGGATRDGGGAATATPGTIGGVTVSTAAGAAADPPIGAPQLLYAGELDGSAVVVLADPTRIGTYTVTGDRRGLRVEPAPGTAADTASAIRIGRDGDASRYLVAPWVARVETRALDGRDWRPLAVADGVSDPVPARSGECWSGPLLRLRAAEVATSAPFVLAELGGGAALTELRYLPSTVDAGGATSPGLDGADGAAAWARLGCPVSDLRGRAPRSVTAWEVWSGRLPQTTGTSRLVCLRATFPGDGNRVSAVLLAPGGGTSRDATVASASDTRLCSRLARDVVVGWWWRSPGGGWHHLAVGSGKVRTIEVTVAGGTRRGTRLVASGPYPAASAPVTVRASTRDGKPVPVLG